MFKKILIANRGDKAISLAAQGDFAQAKSAVVKLTRMRSMPGE